MTTTFLPSIHNAPVVAPQAEPDKARQVFDLMRQHELQGRNGMVWNDMLAAAARLKVERQAVEGWTGHVDPNGFGPNHLVRSLGYRLPDFYSTDDAANNCESLLHNGNGEVDRAWNSWMNSEFHRVHILGLDAFFAGQVHCGIAYTFLADSPKRHYWAVLTCHQEAAK